MPENSIPVVDLSDFLSENAERKKKFVAQLGNAYHEVGFVAVVNHGIPDALIKKFYELVNAFFALPNDTKEQYEVPGLAGQRGYTSFGKEHAKHSNKGDLKEFWQFGQWVEDGDVIQNQYPDNIAVNELPDFNQTGKELYKQFEKCGGELLRAIALFLQLDENYFDDKIHNGNSILRAIYYPPITSEPDGAIRSEQHEDINLITLLVGASAEGLQLLNKQNEWKAITAGPGQIVVNVGDMLQRLTNNYLKSTTHRVVNPPREKWSEPRLSIPFFLHPRSEMRLDCLEGCITENNSQHYEPISAGEYLDERLIEIGLKKK
jgi:isopenicillin N synthase-like dioxygenase